MCESWLWADFPEPECNPGDTFAVAKMKARKLDGNRVKGQGA